MSDRASVFDTSLDFDVSGFTPQKTKTQNKAAPAEAVRAVSEAAHFPSREAILHEGEGASKKEQRRYRTGRNVQLNIKVKSETLDAFYRIADREGWVLGETLEKAIESLQKNLADKMKDSGGDKQRKY